MKTEHIIPEICDYGRWPFKHWSATVTSEIPEGGVCFDVTFTRTKRGARKALAQMKATS